MNLYWVLAVLPLAALGVALINVALWPRGRAGSRFAESVSVLIPARDEAACIESCVRAVLSSRHPVHEVIVYDDGSVDETPQILARLQRDSERLKVIKGRPLPEGWLGKAHACHRLAEAASGKLLCFLDADTVLEPDGLGYAASIYEGLGADVLTALPHQIARTWAERLVIPLLHLSYTSWLALPLIWLSRDPRLLAANGQFIVLRTSVYYRFGGYESVRADIVDDMAFCRRAKSFGLRVVFADGARIARCRMYTCPKEVWEGFSKNVYAGVGARESALWFALALNVGAFLVPWLALPFAGLMPQLAAPSLAGVIANLVERTVLAFRFRLPWQSILLHPLSVIALIAIALNSRRWYRAGKISWRGRVYASSPPGTSYEQPQSNRNRGWYRRPFGGHRTGLKRY